MNRERTQVLVIGSGAGGAVTAATLASAGEEVLIAEEGGPPDHAIQSHSPAAMLSMYRAAGMTPMLGFPHIAAVEGCCVGGSTEVNTAFWNPPTEDMLEAWRAEWGLNDLELREQIDELEAFLAPKRSEEAHLPPTAIRFAAGLRARGHAPEQLPRLVNRDPNSSQFLAGAKRSMSRTFLPRAVASGARLIPHCRVERLLFQGGRAVAALTRIENSRTRIDFDTVFICCGAIQSAVLIQRSGLTRHIGNRLRVIPMVKIAAEFPERVDAHRCVVPPFQCCDAAGHILGGAAFTPGLFALSLSTAWPGDQEFLDRWHHCALYYAAIRPKGTGRVRKPLPFSSPQVRYRLTPEDLEHLRSGLVEVALCLFEGGGVRLHTGISGIPAIHSPKDAIEILGELPTSRMNLSAVHIASTAPMGEVQDCPVDTNGRLRGYSNVYVSDASILPDVPKVNPQALIMALALRTAQRFVDR